MRPHHARVPLFAVPLAALLVAGCSSDAGSSSDAQAGSGGATSTGGQGGGGSSGAGQGGAGQGGAGQGGAGQGGAGQGGSAGGVAGAGGAQGGASGAGAGGASGFGNSSGSGTSGGGGFAQCTEGAKDCQQGAPRTCTNGTWVKGEKCPFVCVDGACQGSCVPGTIRCQEGSAQACDASGSWQPTGASCPLPPRPVSPLSTSWVTSQTPTLRWSLPEGTTGAHVEICKDRACTTGVTSFDVEGTSGAPTSALEPGVYFWRLTAKGGTVPSAAWQFTVGHRSAPVDTSWGSTLDVNGDGFSDLVVAVSFTTDAQGNLGPGKVEIHHGGPAGPSLSPSTTLTGLAASASYGVRVENLGDVNGDGFGDLAVVQAATVSVYLGSAAGLTAASDGLLPDGARWVTRAGDLNGDGYADVFVRLASSSGEGSRVFLGSPSGLTPWPLDVPERQQFIGGDFNGDGLADLTTKAGDKTAQPWYGAPSGVVFGETIDLTAGTTYGSYGRDFSVADVDGDGLADLICDDDVTTTFQGSAGGPQDSKTLIFRGSPAGLVAASPAVLVASFQNNLPGGLGKSAGDVNGDGYADVVMTAGYQEDITGRVYLFLGSAQGIATTPSVTLEGEPGNYHFGEIVAGVGDLDGDGFADVAISQATTDLSKGWFQIYAGSASGLSTTPKWSFPTAYGGFGGMDHSVARVE